MEEEFGQCNGRTFRCENQTHYRRCRTLARVGNLRLSVPNRRIYRCPFGKSCNNTGIYPCIVDNEGTIAPLMDIVETLNITALNNTKSNTSSIIDLSLLQIAAPLNVTNLNATSINGTSLNATALNATPQNVTVATQENTLQQIAADHEDTDEDEDLIDQIAENEIGENEIIHNIHKPEIVLGPDEATAGGTGDGDYGEYTGTGVSGGTGEEEDYETDEEEGSGEEDEDEDEDEEGVSNVDDIQCRFFSRRAHPTQCDKYIVCIGAQPVVRNCPADQAYSGFLRACSRNWSYCRHIGECTKDGELMAEPNDVDSYFICVQRRFGFFATNSTRNSYRVYKRHCADGEIFDEDCKKCVPDEKHLSKFYVNLF